jgi:hypothetical protein
MAYDIISIIYRLLEKAAEYVLDPLMLLDIQVLLLPVRPDLHIIP